MSSAGQFILLFGKVLADRISFSEKKNDNDAVLYHESYNSHHIHMNKEFQMSQSLHNQLFQSILKHHHLHFNMSVTLRECFDSFAL